MRLFSQATERRREVTKIIIIIMMIMMAAGGRRERKNLLTHGCINKATFFFSPQTSSLAYFILFLSNMFIKHI